MKSKLYTLLTVFALLAFLSCEKTVTFDDTQKTGNEAQFNKITANSEYSKLESQSKNGFIMYKVIKSGSGKTPIFTNKVKILYTGWYKNDWNKPDTYKDDKDNVIINKIIFDSTNLNPNGTPKEVIIAREREVRVFIDGFSTALQHMKTGDKWEVWIPWSLGYGATENRDAGIKGYSTLVFEIELVEIL